MGVSLTTTIDLKVLCCGVEMKGIEANSFGAYLECSKCKRGITLQYPESKKAEVV